MVECYVGQDELCRFKKEGEGSLGVDIPTLLCGSAESGDQ